MKVYKTAGIVISVVLICAISWIWFFSKTEAGLEPNDISAEEENTPSMTMVEKEKSFVSPAEVSLTADSAGEVEASETDEALHQAVIVARLNELFANRIDHVGVQLQAIEKLIRYLKKIYPEDWREHVFDYLNLAFPEQATAMYHNFLTLMDYKQWVADNYMLMMRMKTAERSAFLWEKRRQFFGDDTDQIWEMEIKAEQLAQSLKEINAADMPFEQKVNYYLDSIDGIYDNQAEAYKRAYQQNMMDKFLTLENVQADLRKMGPEERNRSLTDFRSAMGMGEAALNRWSALDRVRNQRWENGRAYMQARADVLNQPGGPDREYKLDQLRQSFFGDEAEIIKNEEQSGLFRFSSQRVYGKN
ncbi:MAG: hypothetical protein SWH61_09450 [Thermodesulfobacteriota bacterium]|nr:hypothetical protein [Thermodesulfobacteriota bacterium]